MNNVQLMNDMTEVLGVQWKMNEGYVSDPLGGYGTVGLSMPQWVLDKYGISHDKEVLSEEIMPWVGVTCVGGLAGLVLKAMGSVFLVYIYGHGCKWFGTDEVKFRRRQTGEIDFLKEVAKEPNVYNYDVGPNFNHYQCFDPTHVAYGVEIKISSMAVDNYYPTNLEAVKVFANTNQTNMGYAPYQRLAQMNNKG